MTPEELSGSLLTLIGIGASIEEMTDPDEIKALVAKGFVSVMTELVEAGGADVAASSLHIARRDFPRWFVRVLRILNDTDKKEA